MPQANHFPLIVRQPFERPGESHGSLVAQDALAGGRLIGRRELPGFALPVVARLLAAESTFLNLGVFAYDILNILFVNPPQPGDELGFLFAVKFVEIPVDREAGLLNHIRGIDPRGKPSIDVSFRQNPQIRTVLLQQFTQSLPISTTSTANQLLNYTVRLIHVPLARYRENHHSAENWAPNPVRIPKQIGKSMEIPPSV